MSAIAAAQRIPVGFTDRARGDRILAACDPLYAGREEHALNVLADILHSEKKSSRTHNPAKRSAPGSRSRRSS